MIIGFDKGATATKIIALDNDCLVFSSCVIENQLPDGELLKITLLAKGIDVSQVEKIAVTGVGAEKCVFDGISAQVTVIPEIEATGDGGTWLAKCDRAIVVSIGTGTSLVLAKDGAYSHIGGSGVGSGTLRGLSKKLFGITDLKELFALADNGNRMTVDITIADLFSGTETLPPDLTASNLAKASDSADKADWAKAIVNTVLEVAGSHAAIACGGYGVDSVIITGGVSVTDIAKEVYDGFTRLYKLNYIIPHSSDCATAIGAARRAAHGA